MSSGTNDRAQLWGVVGLSLVAVAIIVLSGVLALRGLDAPSAWDSLAGGAVGSLGTLLVTQRGGGSSNAAQQIQQAHGAAVAQQISRAHNPNPQSPYQQPRHVTPIAPPAPPTGQTGAFTASLRETGLHQEG